MATVQTNQFLYPSLTKMVLPAFYQSKVYDLADGEDRIFNNVPEDGGRLQVTVNIYGGATVALAETLITGVSTLDNIEIEWRAHIDSTEILSMAWEDQATALNKKFRYVQFRILFKTADTFYIGKIKIDLVELDY